MKKSILIKSYIIFNFLIIFILIFANNSFPAVYYIDGLHGNDKNPGTIDYPWKSIGKANFNLNAGDLVYIKKGIYSNQQISPSNSGSNNNYITYRNYKNDEVIISDHAVPIYIKDKDYIKIEGFKIENCVRFFVLYNGSDNNVIKNCTFFKAKGYFGSIFSKFFINPETGGRDKSVSSDLGNNYNKILDNNFVDAPDRCPDGPDQDCDTAPADFLYCEFGSYNLFQGNKFGNSSHDSLVFGNTWTHHNVIRNNVFRNKYRRGIDMYVGTQYNLVEGNHFLDHGLSVTESPRKGSRYAKPWKPGAIQCIKDTKNIIIRKNIFDNNGHVFFSNGEKKYFYNNTANRQLFTVFSDGGNENFEDNKFINNIFSNTKSLNRLDDEKYVYSWIIYVQPGNIIKNNLITHNVFTGHNARWKYRNSTFKSFEEFEAQTDDAFENVTYIPNFIDPEKSNFYLLKDSKLIDAGSFLTIITSPTGKAKKSFMVKDARYFFDGWGIPAEIGDVIKTENGREAIIKKINYETNTLSVEPEIDIIKGEGVSLKFYGKAPDIGAYEFNKKISPPVGLKKK